MAPDANAREALGAGRVTHPRRANIQQRRGLLTVEQRLLERQGQDGVNGHDDPRVVDSVAASWRRRPGKKTALPPYDQFDLKLIRPDRVEFRPTGLPIIPPNDAGKNKPARAYHGVRAWLCPVRGYTRRRQGARRAFVSVKVRR